MNFITICKFFEKELYRNIILLKGRQTQSLQRESFTAKQTGEYMQARNPLLLQVTDSELMAGDLHCKAVR